MKNLLFAIAVFLLVSTASLTAADRNYGASVDESNWNVEQVGKECRLSHEIPLYGEAVFSRIQTGELLFNLRVFQRATKSGRARVTSVSQPWLDEKKDIKLGKVEFTTGSTPLVLREGRAWDLLRQLEQGRSPKIAYKGWTETRDEVAVSISAVRFRDALEQFHRCTQGSEQANSGPAKTG